MKARLLGLVLPASVVGVVVGAGYGGSVLGFIPPLVWHYLWPSLVAFGFLALSLGALLIGARRLLWPLLTGFVVQTIGILLLWGDVYESPWEPLLYSLIAVGIVVLIMLILWLVATLRARWLEQRMVDGVGAGGADQQKIAEIRKNMLGALTLLKRAGRGRNAIYELPWFLVIGRSQGGKTVAIKNSGLGLPVRKDWVKGVGGTHTCDWFFTNDLIFLDTPGAWVTEGAGEEGGKNWVELLRLLRKYRGRRPLDGLVVLVPADDLLSKSDEELREQASNIRQVIDLLHDELRFRFPVYLLVSKCDLVEGFVDFFKGLPAQRRNEILGWSHPDPNQGDPRRLIPQGFQRVVQRLQAYRLEILARIAKTSQARRLFFFTEEFRNLEKPLTMFASVLFADDPYHEPPVFRGFYFTSGTQGEGSPLGQAMGHLARTLGVRLGQPVAGGEEEPKRSYFLLELFRTLLVGDQGLVSRTAIHWWRWRRDTMFVAFLPAGLAVLGFGLSSLSFLLNNKTYGDVRTEVAGIVHELGDYPDPSGRSVIKALDLTDRIRHFHRSMTGFTLLRGFGMRRPGDLADRTFDVFRDEFNRTILKPMLVRAERFATDPGNSCTDRADVFYSVVWLRKGQKAEWSDDLRGLGTIWEMTPDDAEEARRKLLQQFTYLRVHTPSGESLIPGISLSKVAESIAEGCNTTGAYSTLALYVKFQEECRAPATNCEINQCRKTRLERILTYEKEDYLRLRSHLEGLREDLLSLADEEPEAKAALGFVNKIPMPKLQANECLVEFNKTILPAINRYVEQDKLIEACRKEWVAAGRKRGKALEVVREQAKGLEGQEKKLSDMMQEYSANCGDKAVADPFELDANALTRLEADFRRIACQDQDNCEDRVRAAAPPVHAVGTPAPRPAAAAAPAVAVSGNLLFFDAPRPAPRNYTLTGWSTKRQEWIEEVEYAKQLPAGQQAEALRPVQQEIDSYARDYAASWKGYLGSLRLKPKGSVSGWLKGVANTPEFVRLLRPASSAIPPEGAREDPPFDAFSQRLESLGSLAGFVEGRLGEYQSLLAQIAKDVEECERNSGFLRQYLAQISSRSEASNVIRARNWVDLHAGSGLADGGLKALFLQPLEEAEKYIQSPDLARKQWGDLLGLHKALSSRFPFAGEGSDDMADLKDITALLGGQSGLVPVLREAAGQQNLPQDARAWLEGSAALSPILFEEGKDVPRPLRLRLTLGDPVFDPPKLQEDFQVVGVQVWLGEGHDFPWKAGEPKIKSVSVPLLGDEASVLSFVAVTLAERKGALGRTFGSDFKDAVRKEAVQAEGVWAPLRLLERGLPEGAPGTTANSLNLTYSIEVPFKKNQPGKLSLPIRAEGNGVSRLLLLMREGLPAPPPSIGGE